MLEKRIPEFINDLRNISCVKSGKPCKINDPGFSKYACYYVYALPISNEAYTEMMSMSTKKDPLYVQIDSTVKDSRAIFVNTNQYVPAIQFLNKKYDQYHFFLFYSTKPYGFMSNNKSIYIAVKPKPELLFNIIKEESNMYNDELNMTLESAYNEGYYQALADMGYEFDGDEASEDVNIFDENYFTVAAESSSDIVFDMRDFNYMSKSEAEKAYKGTIQRLIRTDYIPTKNSNINPHKMYITKGDLGWWYGISAFKEIIRAVNKIHMNRYNKSSDFLADVDEILRRYDAKVDRASRYAAAAAAGAMSGYYSR